MTTTPAAAFNGHKMTGNRMSSLPAARFCPSAGVLSEKTGAGRSAAVSSAWHARLSGTPDAARLLASLTDEERAEALSWGEPSLLLVPTEDGETLPLRYRDAEKELLVALDDWGMYADPTRCDVLSRGHLDFAWKIHFKGETWAVVGDLKRSKYSSEGPESLQLMAYGFAYASKVGATRFLTANWLAEEQEWRFANEWIELGSERGNALLEDVLLAASNRSTDGEYNFGPHCGSCYGWRLCPSHAVPAPPGLEHIENPTSEEAANYLAYIAAQEKVLDAAKKRIQACVQEGLRVEAGGKRYLPIYTRGRETVSLEQAKAAGVAVSRTKDHYQFRWVNR